MNLIPIALYATYFGIFHTVDRIKINHIVICASFVDAEKKYIPGIATKRFVCCLQIWRIRLTATSPRRKKIDHNIVAGIQNIE